MLELVPAYTLEALDGCDAYRMLTYYSWAYRKGKRLSNNMPKEENTVYRNGKAYRKVALEDASWASSIF